MFDEGLIDLGAFTQNAEAMKKIGDNAEAQILGAGAAMHPYIFVTGGTEYSKAYDPVPPLVGPNGTSYATYRFGDTAGATFVLTNKAEKEAQIAAVKLIDYMFTTEGQIRAHFGEKGIDWEDPKPGDEGLGGEKPLLRTIPGQPDEEPRNTAWGAMGQYYQTKEFRDSWVAGKDIYDTEGYERRLFEATELYNGHQPEEVFPFWAVWISPEDADEAAMLRQNISDYVEQSSLQFVTGSKDLNREWDSYISGFDKLNLSRYLELMQKAYDISFKN
jgi:putative aldouronate transport system substrate-binding protein